MPLFQGMNSLEKGIWIGPLALLEKRYYNQGFRPLAVQKQLITYK